MFDDSLTRSPNTDTVAVGDPMTGEIGHAGDLDWFAVTLEAGKTYQIHLNGASGGIATPRPSNLLFINGHPGSSGVIRFSQTSPSHHTRHQNRSGERYREAGRRDGSGPRA